MSLSLIGIIFVQAFFINNTLKFEKKKFTSDVFRSLSLVSKAIEDKELLSYDKAFKEATKNGRKPDSTEIRRLLIFENFDEDTNQTVQFRNIISEESFKTPSLFFEIGKDSIDIKRFISRSEKKVYDHSPVDGEIGLLPTQTLRDYSTMDDISRIFL
jgi:two-component system phosphate regulon sensor histidine kinase PhoR